MAAPTTALTVIKRFLYRGVAEDWSNHYMLSGSTPADNAAWRTLFDALVAQEKTLYTAATTVVRGYGYDDVGEDAIAKWQVDLTVAPNTPVAGTLTNSPVQLFAGDDAAWVRWGLDRLNQDGKRIYLRKYFHDGHKLNNQRDQLDSNYVSMLTAFGTKMRDGSFAGSRVITDKLGTATVGSGVSTYVTTRTLKRRGKRPGA